MFLMASFSVSSCPDLKCPITSQLCGKLKGNGAVMRQTLLVSKDSELSPLPFAYTASSLFKGVSGRIWNERIFWRFTESSLLDLLQFLREIWGTAISFLGLAHWTIQCSSKKGYQCLKTRVTSYTWSFAILSTEVFLFFPFFFFSSQMDFYSHTGNQ